VRKHPQDGTMMERGEERQVFSNLSELLCKKSIVKGSFDSLM